MLCADLVQVCWTHRGKSQNAEALLEDICASGACLQTEVPVPVGAEVRWRTRKHEFTGQVRYCEYREIGYFVRVELDPGSRWSSRTFRPRHLLDLKRLPPRLHK